MNIFRKMTIAVGRKLKGPFFSIDDDLPISAILSFGIERFFALLRGFFIFPWLMQGSSPAVFLGSGIQFKTKRKIRISRGATIGNRVIIQGLSRGGVKIGRGVNIGANTIIAATSVMRNLGEGLIMGENSGIGQYSFIGCGAGVIIGKNVIMGQYVSFHTENHVYDDLNIPIISQGVVRKPIVIEDDVWVGVKATFLSGAHVGRGAIVAAGAVVRGDVPPFAIVGGVPARVLGSRIRS